MMLPFTAYPEGGRRLIGKPRGDVARRGYGRNVLKWCGFQCVYCGLDMAVFDGWLQLSMDHVIPQQTISSSFNPEWVLDSTNLVACCRSCNDLFNRDPILSAPPTTLEAFYNLRDELFLTRRARIIERRRAERSWFEENVLPEIHSAAASPATEIFSRAWLESSRFVGFRPIADLEQAPGLVPNGPGVYVVLHAATEPPQFLERNNGGWFKGRDPSVPVSVLTGRWHAGTPILYFGKADSLRRRIMRLLRFSRGDPVAHWGGRYLWQVGGSESFEIAWRETDQPRGLEADLLADFAAHFGALPFANINA